MFETKWLTKKEIEELILSKISDEEVEKCKKNHLLVPVLNEIVEGTTDPGKGGTAYFKFRNRHFFMHITLPR